MSQFELPIETMLKKKISSEQREALSKNYIYIYIVDSLGYGRPRAGPSTLALGHSCSSHSSLVKPIRQKGLSERESLLLLERDKEWTAHFDHMDQNPFIQHKLVLSHLHTNDVRTQLPK